MIWLTRYTRDGALAEDMHGSRLRQGLSDDQLNLHRGVHLMYQSYSYRRFLMSAWIHPILDFVP
ncbi:hypothetical protein CERSUDRAFT_115414 [Gelatoporia subvermispora B]|uniref:Uncharacterized protein n=1 Tax=Ceriporiopsis subvermispora (strain B) TaxID=914234 RepID=M2RC91_CERS8|nr:hypothetical protein CERSUDRAFT_115414 [Gelatoporia subvermispora B]